MGLAIAIVLWLCAGIYVSRISQFDQAEQIAENWSPAEVKSRDEQLRRILFNCRATATLIALVSVGLHLKLTFSGKTSPYP